MTEQLCMFRVGLCATILLCLNMASFVAQAYHPNFRSRRQNGRCKEVGGFFVLEKGKHVSAPETCELPDTANITLNIVDNPQHPCGFTSLVHGRIADVKKLVIHNQQLCDLPTHAFAHLTGLEILEISKCKNCQFKNDIANNLGKLKTIVLRSNGFTKIPEFIQRLSQTHPKNVDLSRNKLTSLAFKNPASLLTLHSVDRLDLSKNNIRQLTTKDLFVFMSNVTHLRLSKNHIHELTTPKVFEALHHLKYLDLAKNEMSKIARDDVFDSLDHLHHLDLSQNRLVHLKDGVFDPLIKLHVLNLSTNLLVDLPPFLFSHLTHLRKLALNNNKLKFIGKSVFATSFKKGLLRGATKIHGSNNPWNCAKMNKEWKRKVETIYPQCMQARVQQLPQIASAKKSKSSSTAAVAINMIHCILLAVVGILFS